MQYDIIIKIAEADTGAGRDNYSRGEIPVV